MGKFVSTNFSGWHQKACMVNQVIIFPGFEFSDSLANIAELESFDHCIKFFPANIEIL